MEKPGADEEPTVATNKGKGADGTELHAMAAPAATGGGSSGGEDDAMSSSSVSGGEEDDDTECERRRAACLADMRELEHLFARLKEALIKEKQSLIEGKLKEIEDETAEEFQMTVNKMKQNMEMRIKLANLLRDYKLENAQHFFEYEERCLKESLMNDKTALFDRYVTKIESEIIQLEEKRRQLNLDYEIYQMIQADRASLVLEDEQARERAMGEDEERENKAIDEQDQTSQSQPSQQLRKSARNKCSNADSSSAKTSASCSSIWSGESSGGGGRLGASNFEWVQAQALGQLYARQLDPGIEPYIVYSLSDYEILEDWSILNMHKNSRLNKV